MKRNKHLLSIAAALAVGLCVTACGAQADGPYRLPDWAGPIVEPELEDMENVYATDKVDVYYDNTQSMYGFAGGGTMVRAVAALRDVVNQYSNTTTYTLGGAPDGTLQWMPFTGDLHSSLVDYAGFYTVGKGSFASGTGPP